MKSFVPMPVDSLKAIAAQAVAKLASWEFEPPREVVELLIYARIKLFSPTTLIQMDEKHYRVALTQGHVIIGTGAPMYIVPNNGYFTAIRPDHGIDMLPLIRDWFTYPRIKVKYEARRYPIKDVCITLVY